MVLTRTRTHSLSRQYFKATLIVEPPLSLMMSGQRLPTDPPETMAKRNESAGPATLYTTSAILLFICVFLFQAVAIFKLTQEVNLLKEIQTVAMLKIDSLTQEVSSLKDILDETQLESQSKVQSKVNPSEEAMAVTANPVTCEMTTDTVSSAKTMEPSTTTLMTNTTAETTTNADIVAVSSIFCLLHFVPANQSLKLCISFVTLNALNNRQSTRHQSNLVAHAQQHQQLGMLTCFGSAKVRLLLEIQHVII